VYIKEEIRNENLFKLILKRIPNINFNEKIKNKLIIKV